MNQCSYVRISILIISSRKKRETFFKGETFVNFTLSRPLNSKFNEITFNLQEIISFSRWISVLTYAFQFLSFLLEKKKRNIFRRGEFRELYRRQMKVNERGFCNVRYAVRLAARGSVREVMEEWPEVVQVLRMSFEGNRVTGTWLRCNFQSFSTNDSITVRQLVRRPL